MHNRTSGLHLSDSDPEILREPEACIIGGFQCFSESPRHSVGGESARRSPAISTPDRASCYPRESSSFLGHQRMGELTSGVCSGNDPSTRLMMKKSNHSYSIASSLTDHEDSTPPPPSTEECAVSENRDELMRQLEYHRHRQDAIRTAIQEFERKMGNLLDWHKEQESIIHLRMLNEVGGCATGRSSGLRRGHSRLRERLYAAIDHSMT